MPIPTNLGAAGAAAAAPPRADADADADAPGAQGYGQQAAAELRAAAGAYGRSSRTSWQQPAQQQAGYGQQAAQPQRSRSRRRPAQPQAAQPRRRPRSSRPGRQSPSPALTFSHEGPRYILGYSNEYFGIWDKAAPGPPVARFARTEQGWQEAWNALVGYEMRAAGR